VNERNISKQAKETINVLSFELNSSDNFFMLMENT
jgi:hypothetical protein